MLRFAMYFKTVWQGFGWKPGMAINLSNTRQTIRGICGGYCGGCAPENAFLRIYEPDGIHHFLSFKLF